MDLKKDLVQFIEETLNNIDLVGMYMTIKNEFTIDKGMLVQYVEALYYHLVIDGDDSDDKPMLLNNTKLLKDDNVIYSQISYMWLIYSCMRIRNKSKMNLYI